MRETINKMLASIREYLAKMPRKNKVQMAVLALFVVVLAIVVVSLLTQTKWTLLPNTGDAVSTSHIYAALDEMNVPTDVRGNLIYVPEKMLGDVQMRLRERNLLGSPGLTYELFAEAAGFGVSSEHARKTYDFQLGEHISTMLEQRPRIQNALVIVNSGESSSFRIQSVLRKPTAAITLALIGGSLSTEEAQSIADTVKTAVPGIEFEDISIVDIEGKSYRIGDTSMDFDTLYTQRMGYQNRLMEQAKSQIEYLITPIYGPENIRVQPTIIINFDNIVISQTELFPPVPGSEEGLVVSMEELYEMSRRGLDAEGVPGTDSNAMGSTEYPWGNVDERTEYWRHLVQRNYEFNETRTAIDVAQGKIEEISIAVSINSDVEGIDQDYTAELSDLISKAIGVSPSNIAIQYLPFNFYDTTWADMLATREAEAAQARMDRLIEQILMYGTILLLAIMVILFVRATLKTFRPPPEPEEILVAAGPGGMDIIIGDEDIGDKEFEEVDIKTKSPGLEQIERFIDKDAAIVAQLLRNWLSDE